MTELNSFKKVDKKIQRMLWNEYQRHSEMRMHTMTVMIYHNVLVVMQCVWALFVAVLHRDAWTRMAPPF